MSADSYVDLFEDLCTAYESRHNMTAIEGVAAELAGQTPSGTSLELLDRPARQRLEDLPPSRSPS